MNTEPGTSATDTVSAEEMDTAGVHVKVEPVEYDDEVMDTAGVHVKVEPVDYDEEVMYTAGVEVKVEPVEYDDEEMYTAGVEVNFEPVEYDKEVAMEVTYDEAISVKIEREDAENADNAVSAMRSQSIRDVYASTSGRPVPFSVSLYYNDSSKLTDEHPCIESNQGRLEWKYFESHSLPCVIRKQNGKEIHYVSKRMVEMTVFHAYLRLLSPDIHACHSVKLHLITESEATSLNQVITEQYIERFGDIDLVAGRDYIFTFEDLQEYHSFLLVCRDSISNYSNPTREQRCGFIRINSESIFPYSIKNNKKYIPLFYLKGHEDDILPKAIEIKNWDLAYLKFCFEILGEVDFSSDCNICAAVDLEVIKTYLKKNILIEDVWPTRSSAHIPELIAAPLVVYQSLQIFYSFEDSVLSPKMLSF